MADGVLNFRIEDIVDDARWMASQQYISNQDRDKAREEAIKLLKKSGAVVGLQTGEHAKNHLFSGAVVPYATLQPGEAKRLLDNLDVLHVPHTIVIPGFYYEIPKGPKESKLYLFVEG